MNNKSVKINHHSYYRVIARESREISEKQGGLKNVLEKKENSGGYGGDEPCWDWYLYDGNGISGSKSE